MMNIGLIDVDRLNNRKGKKAYPNLAMMKISAYHKAQGDNVEWYDGFTHYDIVYMSKAFNFTPDYPYPINADQVIKGGTGYDIHSRLSPEIEFIEPDYDLYQVPKDTAYGFITRGCPNKCKWCVVPQKEGKITPYMDIEDIAVNGRNKVILMDNNILASEYGLSQIQKIIDLGLRVDFNQALDARLVTPEIGKLLARVKWLNIIRFGCDTQKQIQECERAISYIDGAGYKGQYFFYCILMNDFQESFSRVNHWKNKGGGGDFSLTVSRIVIQTIQDTLHPNGKKTLQHGPTRSGYSKSASLLTLNHEKDLSAVSISNPLLPLSSPDTAMELSSDVGVSHWFLGNRPKLRTKRTRLLSSRFSG